MLAWLSGWEIAAILAITLILLGRIFGGGGPGIQPAMVCADVLEWIARTKEELWVKVGLKRPGCEK